MRRVIQIAAKHGNTALTLGAFGCGVFGNDPREIAQIEKELLVDEGLGSHFDIIANPIISTGGRSQNLPAFREVLGPFMGT
jgi:uncharacterized protein (TIGR02452 family)